MLPGALAPQHPRVQMVGCGALPAAWETPGKMKHNAASAGAAAEEKNLKAIAGLLYDQKRFRFRALSSLNDCSQNPVKQQHLLNFSNRLKAVAV